MYNFQSLSHKCPTIFWSLIFSISLPRLPACRRLLIPLLHAEKRATKEIGDVCTQATPQVKLFFVEKGNLKFSESKMRSREESEKLLIPQNFKLQQKFSGK